MDRTRELDRLSQVYLAALHGRDWRTLAALWARADYEPDVAGL